MNYGGKEGTLLMSLVLFTISRSKVKQTLTSQGTFQ